MANIFGLARTKGLFVILCKHCRREKRKFEQFRNVRLESEMQKLLKEHGAVLPSDVNTYHDEANIFGHKARGEILTKALSSFQQNPFRCSRLKKSVSISWFEGPPSIQAQKPDSYQSRELEFWVSKTRTIFCYL